MNRFLRVLIAAAFVAAGWINAPMTARPCCPCTPAPGCCPLTAPSAHALPAQAPRPKPQKTEQAPAVSFFSVAPSDETWATPAIQSVQGIAAKHRRAWLRVWRI